MDLSLVANIIYFFYIVLCMFVGHCVRFSVIVSPHIVPSHYVDFKIY